MINPNLLLSKFHFYGIGNTAPELRKNIVLIENNTMKI